MYRPSAATSTADEMETVAHLFEMKNRGSDINYYVEAKATLTAISDLAVRHALRSLEALSTAFEAHGYLVVKANAAKHPGVERGLEEYNTAVSKLASCEIGDINPTFIRTSLVCCRLFIAIEVRLGDFSLAVQHFVRGLHIMYQSCSRPSVDAEGRIVPGSKEDIPLLDLFIIKLFASANPVRWQMERPPSWQADMALAVPNYVPLRSNARLELATLSTEVTSFLCYVTSLRHQHQIQGLLQWKAKLLETLQDWHDIHAEPIKDVMNGASPIRLRYAIAFAPFLYQILKIVTRLAMGNAVEALNMLSDFEDLGGIASYLTELRKQVSDFRDQHK